MNPNRSSGLGFRVYRMAPVHVTASHRHGRNEEFLVVEGEIIDHDGYRYGPGDLVSLRDGTEHCSRSPDGCLLAVYLPGATSLKDGA